MSKIGFAVQHRLHPRLGIGVIMASKRLGGRDYFQCWWANAPQCNKFICSHVLKVI